MKQLEEILNYSILEFDSIHLKVSTIVSLLLIFFLIKLGLRLVKAILKKAIGETNLSKRARISRLYQLIQYVMYIIGLGLCVKALGFDITIILGASAALLVGVGLGLQEVFRDVFSGIVLLIEGTCQVGDVIEIEGMVGRVRQIDLRTSKIETRDGTYVILPNSKLVTDSLINWSINRRDTRFNISVGVAYGSDTELVSKILSDIAGKHEKVAKNVPIWVRFEDFGDSALVFRVYFWTHNQWEIEGIKSDLRFEIDQAFRNEKISIPFPQRDLHLKTDVNLAQIKTEQ